jgi:hypothetical protein
MYFEKAAVDLVGTVQTMRDRVAIWNEIQFRLSNVLSIALNKGLKVYTNDKYHLQRLASMQKSSKPVYYQCNTYGSVKFWSLKRVMHSTSDHTADIMREHINKHEMKCNASGVLGKPLKFNPRNKRR